MRFELRLCLLVEPCLLCPCFESAVCCLSRSEELIEVGVLNTSGGIETGRGLCDVACGLGAGKGRGIARFGVKLGVVVKVVGAVVDDVELCVLAGRGDERGCG